MSDEKRYESTSPEKKYGTNRVIIEIDGVNDKNEAIIDEQKNNFCNDIGPQNLTCFSYKKDNHKDAAKVNRSHQFPNLAINEVTSSIDTLFPNFNKCLKSHRKVIF